MSFINSLVNNLYSPLALFFLLGFFASKLKSNLRLPESITQALGYYLILAVGFRGGVELSRHPVDLQALTVFLMAIFLSFNLPFIIYGLFRKIFSQMRPADTAAIAAHYGSVSLVTFIAATSFLAVHGEDHESYLVVCITLMEAPAIVAALLIKHFWLSKNDPHRKPMADHLRQMIFPGSSVLLVGSFLVGVLSGDDGALYTYGFLNVPFQGILCFFLLDMGLVAGLQLEQLQHIHRRLLAFGVLAPIVLGSLGIAVAVFLGLSPGGATLLAVLCGSASHIVVPAALRTGMPEADHSLAMTLALGVTFPFNIIFGVPLYHWLSLQLV